MHWNPLTVCWIIREIVEEQLMDLSDLTNDNNSRYTLIRMDGTVVADTEVAQVNQMENHLERKEVKDALATGYGYSVRRSGTLGMQMAYCGDPFIGTANTYCAFLPVSTGLGEYILMLIPAAFLSFGIAFFCIGNGGGTVFPVHHASFAGNFQ